MGHPRPRSCPPASAPHPSPHTSVAVFSAAPRARPAAMADTIPAKLKDAQLVPFAKRAAQLERVKPIIAFWRKFRPSEPHGHDAGQLTTP